MLRHSRIELTRPLVDWMTRQATPAPVLISGSATGWYGNQGEQLLDEASASGPADFGSELCHAWEQEAERARQSGVRVVLLRTAPVLSPTGGMLGKLRLPCSLGRGGRVGSGQQWMPWIALQDEVALIDFLLHHTECSGVFNACAPGLVRNAQFTQALATALHRPAILPAPAWALQLALGEMSVLLLGGQRLQPRRALEAGFVFRYPELGAALAQLV